MASSITIHDPIVAFLRIAKEFRGVRERDNNCGDVPDFANWFQGRDMRDYPMGLRHAPWCSTWVNLVGRLTVGAAWPIPVGSLYSDVDEMVKWARAKNVWYSTPELGDLGCVRGNDGWKHIFIVTRIADSQVGTIEGNTNEDGSFNGVGVFERIRQTSSSGYIRWLEAIK
jgi:hypothetical protein